METVEKVNRDWLINSFCLAMLAGVSLVSWRVGFSLFGILVPMAWVFWLWEFRQQWRKDLIILMLIGLLIGGIRMYLTAEAWRKIDLPNEHNWTGMVVGFPSISSDGQQILVKVKDLLIELRLPPFQEILPDDQLSFDSFLIAATDLTWAEGLRENFFRQNIQAIAKKPASIELLPKTTGDIWQGILRAIFGVRKWMGQILNNSLAEPAASLIAGILIGDKGNLSTEVISNFQKTGLTHILAISGFNITIIINLILLFLASSGKTWRLTGSLILIGGFVLLTGASASVIRAGVMGLMALAVKIAGRKLKPLKLILLSTALITFWSPAILDFDLSFQMSLVATMSLIFFAEDFAKEGLNGWKEWIWEGVSLTLAAQVLTLPIIFFGFGRISLISPLSNLLVGPFIPILMLLGAVLILINLFLPFLAVLLSGTVQILVNLMLWIIAVMANLPLAQVEFGQGQIWIAVVYYYVLFLVVRRRNSYFTGAMSASLC